MSLLKKREEIRNFLKEIVKENKLDGVIIADMEGLPVISYTAEELDEDTVSASLAAILSAGEISASDVGKRNLHQVIVDTEDGYIVILPVSKEYVIGIITDKDAKLGIVRLVAKEIEKYLESLM
ncbi:roadblock/LC7 domain-containing protein [Aquifex sp.]